jgi:hypothetical protein
MTAIDREIESALAIDPSPEFLARVRERIAGEPAPLRRGVWLVFANGLAVAVVGAIAVMASFHNADRGLVPVLAPSPAPAAVSGPASAVSVPPAGVVRSGVDLAIRPAGQRVHARLWPDVLVSAGDARAIRALRDVGRVDLAVALSDAPSASVGRVEPQAAFEVVTLSGGITPVEELLTSTGVHQ